MAVVDHNGPGPLRAVVLITPRFGNGIQDAVDTGLAIPSLRLSLTLFAEASDTESP